MDSQYRLNLNGGDQDIRGENILSAAMGNEP
jgi:hypothetical protein